MEEAVKLEMMTKQEVLVRISRDELIMLNNALNEVTHGLDSEEFQTRMGFARGETKDLLQQLSSVIESMK